MVSSDIEQHSELTQNLISILQDIYPEKDCSFLNNFAGHLANQALKNLSPRGHRDRALWSASDVLLIAYPDNIYCQNTPPLKSLQKFLTEHLSNIISIVHVLPFFPSTGDDGFSVQNYFEVDEKLGDWSDIGEFVKNSTLMVDVVLNHCSVKNEWFIGYQNGDPMYENFFCTVPEDFDISNIVRPRSSSLKQKFLVNGEERDVWCTFSSDQADLNFKNPKVLRKLIDVIFCYIELLRGKLICY